MNGGTTMQRSLTRQFADLDRQKAAVLAGIADWSEVRQRFRPEPAAWSTLDVMDHLTRMEEVVLQRLRVPPGGDGGVTQGERVRAWMVRAVLRSPVRVSLPRGGEAVAPGAVRDLAEVTARWAEARSGLRAFAEELTPVQSGRAAFVHPRSGQMTFAMTLGFVEAHLQHHRYQLRRLRKASRVAVV